MPLLNGSSKLVWVGGLQRFRACGAGAPERLEAVPVPVRTFDTLFGESSNTLSDLRRDAEGCGRGRPRSPILPHRAGLEMGGLAGKWRRRKNI